MVGRRKSRVRPPQSGVRNRVKILRTEFLPRAFAGARFLMLLHEARKSRSDNAPGEAVSNNVMSRTRFLDFKEAVT